uniref:Mitochondrial fission 1 protein n=1 Tax=Brassica campestris TaxID=3711 RepID=M4EZM5_BRACM
MDSKMGNFFDSIGSFFSGGDKIPWCDRDVILECEKEVKTATDGDSEDQKKESIMRLSWALVHSRQAEDIQRGIAMLEDGVIGIGITATAVGLIAGGIAAALARKK